MSRGLWILVYSSMHPALLFLLLIRMLIGLVALQLDVLLIVIVFFWVIIYYLVRLSVNTLVLVMRLNPRGVANANAVQFAL